LESLPQLALISRCGIKTARTNNFHLRTGCFGLAGEKSGPAASANAAAEGGFGGVEGSGWLPS